MNDFILEDNKVSQGSFPGRVSLQWEDLSIIWMSGTLLDPVETIDAKVYVSTWDTIILVEIPKRALTCLGSMISTNLESPDGGEKSKVVLAGSDEGSSGLASCHIIVDVSIFCSMVSPVLVSSKTFLSFWIKLSPT